MRINRRNCNHFNLDPKCHFCISLFDEWNSKLKKSEDESFTDVEVSSGKHKRMLKSDCQAVSLLDKDKPSQTQEKNFGYYRSLDRAYQKEVFKDPISRIIMFERSRAKKIAEIVRIIAAVKGRIINRETVRFIIRRFEFKWGIRFWTNTQMGLGPKKPAPILSFIIRRPNSQFLIETLSIQSF